MKAAEELIRRQGGKRQAREELAALVFRGIEILVRDRQRSSRSRPERWPDDSRPSPGRPVELPADLVMPVEGVRWEDLQDSFGDPRSGGRRHRGIDIFAPRWTGVLAVTDGALTSMAVGGLAGRSLWLVGDDGRSYFYGHIQAWAAGTEEGLTVVPGDLIAYVGNSGNAARTPTHLHFEVHERGRAINPYSVLASAEPVDAPTRLASRRTRGRRGG